MKSLYKILHTTCHTGWGGLEKRIFNESVWMENNGHKIIIAAPADTPLYIKAKKQGFKVYDIRFGKLSVGKDFRQLKHIFYHEKPWVLNTHGNWDTKLALFAAKNSEIPLKIISRHISAPVSNSWYNRRLYKKWCDYIFTTADYTTRHLQALFGLNSMRVFSMPSGIIPPGSLFEKKTARKMLAEELGLEKSARFLGFVGRISMDKGITTLIDAFARIRQKLPSHRLIIVGEGIPAYIDSLKQQANRLGISDQIFFAGYRDDVWPLYRALDVKVLPSRNIRGIPVEGVPLSLLEAMYAGCPVIGSKSGGIMDIIEDKKTGLLFDPDNPNNLAEKILQVMDTPDLRNSLSETARQKVVKSHTIDAMGRNIVRIYRLHQVRLDKTPY